MLSSPRSVAAVVSIRRSPRAPTSVRPTATLNRRKPGSLLMSSCRCYAASPSARQVSRTSSIPATNLTLGDWKTAAAHAPPLEAAILHHHPDLDHCKHKTDQQSTSHNSRQRNHLLLKWFSTLADSPPESSSLPTATLSVLEKYQKEHGFHSDDNEIDLFRDMSPQQLHELASHQPTPLRLADMYKYGQSQDLFQRMRNAQFLYKELPIRLSHRAVELLTLPHGLANVAPIREVAAIFIQYAAALLSADFPTTAEKERAFTDLLESFIMDRTSIPNTIAHGVQVWLQQQHLLNKNEKVVDAEQNKTLEQALYRFFTARVGLRLLTEHFILSSPHHANDDQDSPVQQATFLFPPTQQKERRTGAIQTAINIADQARKVADLLKQQTDEYYQKHGEKVICPEIHIVDCNPHDAHDFTYAPHHLQYMLTELLQNSIRATIRHAKLNQSQDGRNEVAPPPIKVVIAKGEEDVTIKIADRGGGIARSNLEKIWKFAHSTTSQLDQNATTVGAKSSFHLRGFGLPLARIYARYFGGELTLKSTEGYGLDAYLYLPRLGDAACENLPLRVQSSPGEWDSMPQEP